MFEKLFKSKFEHADTKVRLNAVKALSGDKNKDTTILCHLALNDTNISVREQAINQMRDIDGLKSILVSLKDDDSLKKIVNKQLETVLIETTSLDSSTAVELMTLVERQSLKEKLVTVISDTDQLLDLVETLDDQGALTALALKSRSPVVRKSAAEKTTAPEHLKQLQQQSSDKNILKIVRKKIQLIKELDKAKVTASDTLIQICEALERLSKLKHEPMMVNRLNVLESHWQQVEKKYKDDYQDRYQQARQQCQQLINMEQQQLALEELRLSQDQICQSLSDSYENEIINSEICDIHQWREKKQKIENQWKDVCKNSEPQVQISENFTTLKNAAHRLDGILSGYQNIIGTDDNVEFEKMDIESLISLEQRIFRLKQTLNLPDSYSPPLALSQINSRHGEIKAKLEVKQKSLTDKVSKIDQKIRILKSHIFQKNLIKANRLVNFIHNLIDELPKSCQENENHKLNAVTKEIEDLRDLNKYITHPKKQQLCQQMEELIDNKLNPETLMGQIKTIQEKWKSLATSDAEADDILWDRFKRACDEAYLPCAAYLAELEKTKHKNYTNRKKLSEKLESELFKIDWEKVDWIQVQTKYNHYRSEWRDLSPVFYSENKPIQQHFDSLMNQIREKLDSEKNENHTLYDRLIERATELADLNDDEIGKAVEQAKRLQNQWKNVGITYNNQTNKQWKKFRKQCDLIFDRQHKMYTEEIKHENQQANEANTITSQIKELAKTPDDKLFGTKESYKRLQAEFEALSAMPKKTQKNIFRQFQQACEQYEKHLAGLQQRNKLNAYKLIRKAASLCSMAETLAIESPDQGNFIRIKSDFDSILNLPKDINKKFKTRLGYVEKVISGESEYCDQTTINNEKMLSMLAIEMEVLFDIESPQDAKQQRMKYQLDQLQAGIKPAPDKQQKQQQLIKTELHWYSIGAVNPTQRQILDARLAAIINKA